MSQVLRGEDIGNGREAVVGLCGRDMVNVGGAGEIRARVRDVTREGERLVTAGEGLVQGSGLNDSLVGKLFVGRSDDAQPRGSLSPRGVRGFGSYESWLPLLCTVYWGVTGLRGLL